MSTDTDPDDWPDTPQGEEPKLTREDVARIYGLNPAEVDTPPDRTPHPPPPLAERIATLSERVLGHPLEPWQGRLLRATCPGAGGPECVDTGKPALTVTLGPWSEDMLPRLDGEILWPGVHIGCLVEGMHTHTEGGLRRIRGAAGAMSCPDCADVECPRAHHYPPDTVPTAALDVGALARDTVEHGLGVAWVALPDALQQQLQRTLEEAATYHAHPPTPKAKP